MFVSRGLVVGFTVALAGVLLAGCGTRLNKAPVEDRGTSSNHASSPSVQPGTVVATPIKPLPGAENAGKPGYYTRQARRHPDSHWPGNRSGLEDIARWNNLENPNLIEVGQVLRVTSTVPAPPSAAAALLLRIPVSSRARWRRLRLRQPLLPARQVPQAPVSAPASTASAASAPAAAPAASPAAAGDEDVAFIWPASGALLAGFDEVRNKGYDIAGKAGDLSWPQRTDVWCTQARVCVVMAT